MKIIELNSCFNAAAAVDMVHYILEKVRPAMKVAICDNDMGFVIKLKNSIDDHFAYHDIRNEYSLFDSSVKLIEAELSQIDVLFLDIDMPEINGIEAARCLRKKYPDMILVFVTDYIEYAPAGYRVEAFRYLLKSRLDRELSCILDEIMDKLYADQAAIQVKSRGEYILLQLKNIVYIEGTGRRMVLVHLTGEKTPLECSGKLAEFEDRLINEGFLRLQRSFLANIRHIKKISSYTACLDNGTELKVTDKNYNRLRSSFLAWKGKNI